MCIEMIKMFISAWNGPGKVESEVPAHLVVGDKSHAKVSSLASPPITFPGPFLFGGTPK